MFPASVGADKLMRGFHKVWLRVAKRADLDGEVTPHVLRHSYASEAADLGFSELTIAALLGHKKASVTSNVAVVAFANKLARTGRCCVERLLPSRDRQWRRSGWSIGLEALIDRRGLREGDDEMA